MYTTDILTRVIYGDTDKMGYVYYGNYCRYFEYARTEALRELGIIYNEVEKQGFYLPVISVQIQYKKPAVYDDLLIIRTSITKLPSIRLHFSYDIFNQENSLLVHGDTELVFMNSKTNKPCHAPDWFIDKLKPYYI